MGSSKRIAVSGATGFIGSALCEALREAGYGLVSLTRKKTSDVDEIFYDYQTGEIEADKLRRCYAVIHLAGRNIMSGLWTKKVKDEIYKSRVKSTRFIAESLARMPDGPRILLVASAVGIYGDKSDQKLDEESHPGHGFLAKLCIDWEAATKAAKLVGLRVVNMRFGVVLDKHGGMLKGLMPIYRLGLGGPLGSGEQFMTYVTLKELIAQILFLLKADTISGPVNCTSLEPTTNEEFSQALARMLKRPALLRTPGFLFKLLGDQSELFLASTRAYPKVLLDHRFSFEPEHRIEGVLGEVLSCKSS